MNAEKVLRLYIRHTERWLKVLDDFTPDTFTRDRPGEWSAAEVVDHICKTTAKCLSCASICLDHQGERGHSGFGPAIFSMMGAFPPVRLRIKEIPAGLEEVYLPRKISLDEARKGLKHSVQLMENIQPRLAGADPAMRYRHWAGGWFNALQWYHNAEMHIKHHFRQLKRIQKNTR